jgi:hypothetical protein
LRTCFGIGFGALMPASLRLIAAVRRRAHVTSDGRGARSALGANPLARYCITRK